MREIVAGTVGAKISANFVPPIPAFSQPNLNKKQLKKTGLGEKIKKKKRKKEKKKETKNTLWWMGSSTVVVVVRLGLLVEVRWLGRRSRTGDGERMVVGFGRRWRTHSRVVDGGCFTVGLRRGEEMERGREGKIWGGNGLGKKWV
jgi:hypothetical protein